MKFYKFLNFLRVANSRYLLGFVSFIESVFFPIPPDLLLTPMILSNRFNWKNLAFITTITSVIGGICGYYLGNVLFNEINIYIIEYGYLDDFNLVKSIFIEYGVIVVFVSGFTPIPYKIFNIAAGFISLNIFMFIIVSLFGRGLRFYLVGYLSNRYRENINTYLNRYMIQITLIILIIFFVYKLYM